MPIVRLFHPQSRDSQGQQTFVGPSADKQTCSYDKVCPNQQFSQSQTHTHIHKHR